MRRDEIKKMRAKELENHLFRAYIKTDGLEFFDYDKGFLYVIFNKERVFFNNLKEKEFFLKKYGSIKYKRNPYLFTPDLYRQRLNWKTRIRLKAKRFARTPSNLFSLIATIISITSVFISFFKTK